MSKQTDFRPIIRRLLDSGKYSEALLAHECGCSQSNIKKLRDAAEPTSPGYDIGRRLLELDQALKSAKRRY